MSANIFIRSIPLGEWFSEQRLSITCTPKLWRNCWCNSIRYVSFSGSILPRRFCDAWPVRAAGLSSQKKICFWAFLKRISGNLNHAVPCSQKSRVIAVIGGSGCKSWAKGGRENPRKAMKKPRKVTCKNVTSSESLLIGSCRSSALHRKLDARAHSGNHVSNRFVAKLACHQAHHCVPKGN